MHISNMKEATSYYRDLLKKYLHGDCSSMEAEELFKYLQEEKSNPLLRENLQEEFRQVLEERASIPTETSERLRNKLLNRISAAPLVVSKRRIYVRIAAAAAAVVLLTAGGSYWWMFRNPPKPVAKIEKSSKKYTNDVSPGGDKAILTLADGSTIVLDNANNGTLTQQGNTKVIKIESGELSYTGGNAAPGEVLYNTVSTPRGGQYQVILSDGTKVWLNAASSLRFPTAFNGNERVVDISGEVYFEVAKNPSMPFKVNVGETQVEVLGTHFNIMAYGDEKAIATTLLEGAVKISKGTNAKVLKPGQQAIEDKDDGAIRIDPDADVDQAVAWKNGLFHFSDVSLQAIMRQIGRWYDVDISYDANVPNKEFTGKISRNINASEVLNMLEYAGVHFKIEGKKITVIP